MEFSSVEDIMQIHQEKTQRKEYIQNQLKEDYTKDQISIKEYMDPFTVEKTKI